LRGHHGSLLDVVAGRDLSVEIMISPGAFMLFGPGRRHFGMLLVVDRNKPERPLFASDESSRHAIFAS
jgi:hypothetical protein